VLSGSLVNSTTRSRYLDENPIEKGKVKKDQFCEM
jgi:hypothetical protein